jgi:glutathione gamma-glutamylcysteinyltransferase
MTFSDVQSAAKCNGLNVVAKRADKTTFEEFIHDLKTVSSSSDKHIVASFSRPTLAQTGDGHFSPIGCFEPESRQVLVLDTARFKYPSYFVDARLLYDAMKPIDAVTNLPRGYFILTKGISLLLRNHQSAATVSIVNLPVSACNFQITD